MVYVNDLAKLISELKKDMYAFEKDTMVNVCWNISKDGIHVGYVCCNTRSITGYDAHINEIIEKYIKPDIISTGDEALAASEI